MYPRIWVVQPKPNIHEPIGCLLLRLMRLQKRAATKVSYSCSVYHGNETKNRSLPVGQAGVRAYLHTLVVTFIKCVFTPYKLIAALV